MDTQANMHCQYSLVMMYLYLCQACLSPTELYLINNIIIIIVYIITNKYKTSIKLFKRNECLAIQVFWFDLDSWLAPEPSRIRWQCLVSAGPTGCAGCSSRIQGLDLVPGSSWTRGLDLVPGSCWTHGLGLVPCHSRIHGLDLVPGSSRTRGLDLVPGSCGTHWLDLVPSSSRIHGLVPVSVYKDDTSYNCRTDLRLRHCRYQREKLAYC